ncbi:MAG: hypothetical protein GWP59_08860 [Chlamydiales bacterium]|nr:hypothetical protein [Chlamydiales bacterium]NCF71795.1 hypothetical protein [Chlamydiales bacterium]
MTLISDINSYSGDTSILVTKVSRHISRGKNLIQLQRLFKNVEKTLIADLYSSIHDKHRDLNGTVGVIKKAQKDKKTVKQAITLAKQRFATVDKREITNLAKAIYTHKAKVKKAKAKPAKRAKVKAKPAKKKVKKSKLTRIEKNQFPAMGHAVAFPHGEVAPAVPADVASKLTGEAKILLSADNPFLSARALPQGLHLQEDGNPGEVYEYDLRQKDPAIAALKQRIGRNDTLGLRHHSTFGHYKSDNYHMAKMRTCIEADGTQALPKDLKKLLQEKGINLSEARVLFRIWEPPKVNGKVPSRLNVVSHAFAEKETNFIDPTTGDIVDPNQKGSVTLGVFNAMNMEESTASKKKARAPFGKLGNVGYHIHLGGGAIKASPNNAHVNIANTKKSSACWMVVKKGNRWEVSFNHFLSPGQVKNFNSLFNRADSRAKTANVGCLVRNMSTKKALRGIVSSMVPFLAEIPAENIL